MTPDNESSDPMRTPLWRAFTATAAAILFAVAGIAGYQLGKQRRAAHMAWTGHVVWPEVAIGVASGCLAVYFWTRALRAASTTRHPAPRQ